VDGNHDQGSAAQQQARAAMKLATIFAIVLLVVLATSAAAQPLPPTDRDLARDRFRDLAPPSVACPDQQTLDEVEALRRLGDREAKPTPGRSPGGGPAPRPRFGRCER